MNKSTVLSLVLSLLLLCSPVMAESVSWHDKEAGHRVTIVSDDTATTEEADSLAKAFLNLFSELELDELVRTYYLVRNDEGVVIIGLETTDQQLGDENLMGRVQEGIQIVAGMAFPEMNVDLVVMSTESEDTARTFVISRRADFG